MSESSTDVIQRYVEEAAAFEKDLEAQMHEFANAAPQPSSQVFEQCALSAKHHNEVISARLHNTPSGEGLLAHLFAPLQRTVHKENQKDLTIAQRLIIAFAAENGGIAYYEALAGMASAASDPDTEALVRSIQREKREAAKDIWRVLTRLTSLP